jgi:glyoxylase-like metal-dependent hydrolase (beta-lactamase superfamily II)
MPETTAREYAERWRTRFVAGSRQVIGLSDGAFFMAEGFMNRPGLQHDFEDAQGVAAMPLASFLLPGERNILIDTGLGDRRNRILCGGALLDEIATAGFVPSDIDEVAVSHLHLDHDGWIANADASPVFPNARYWIGRGDFEHFVAGDDPALERFRLAPHLLEALKSLHAAGRVNLIDDTAELQPGVVAIPAPGHTPGHLVFAIGDHHQRLLILGDSMYCPEQLTDADLTAVHDVDPGLARRTRESIQREMERHGTSAVGCHFPGLAACRVLGGRAVPA